MSLTQFPVVPRDPKQEAKVMQKRSRGWILVKNNWSDESIAEFMSVEGARYKIVGFERGKECNTPHMQCYIYFHNARSGLSVSDMFPKWHIEDQKGTDIQAAVYCLKEGDCWEYGDRPQQGKHTDMEFLKYDIKYQKKTLKDCYNSNFARTCQYSRQLKQYIEYCNHERHGHARVFYYRDEQICKIYQNHTSMDGVLVIEKYSELSTYHSLLHKIYCGQYHTIYIPEALYRNCYNALKHATYSIADYGNKNIVL